MHFRNARLAIRLVFSGVSVLVALWLLLDATTYSLYASDPSSGRPRGCFTALDLMLGVGPSEGGILRGTRAVEIALGIPLVIAGCITFVRALWRSPFETPVVGFVGAIGTWLAGRAFFWRFHDTNVYLTWRIIGNAKNDTIAAFMAAAVLLANIVGVSWLIYQARRKGHTVETRTVAYSALSSYFVTLTLAKVDLYSGVVLVLLASPLLCIPILVAVAKVWRAQSAV